MGRCCALWRSVLGHVQVTRTSKHSNVDEMDDKKYIQRIGVLLGTRTSINRYTKTAPLSLTKLFCSGLS